MDLKEYVNIANGLTKLGWEIDLIVLNLKNNDYQFFLSEKINLVTLNAKHVRYSILSLLKYIFQKKTKIIINIQL